MISVVIPVKNRETLVKRTLDSLAAQTMQPELIVLVDNGSTDGTLQVLNEFAAGRDNVIVTTESTPGAAEARNCGLSLVKSRYVMFFDSDDVMPPRHIEQIFEGLYNAGLPQIAAFDMVQYNLDGSIISKPFRGGDLMFNHIFHTILSTQRCVIDTDFLTFLCGGWPTKMPVWDDYVLGVKMLTRVSTISYLPLDEPVKIYATEDSITGTEYSSRAGQWEHALYTCEQILRDNDDSRYVYLLRYRRAILAGNYRREGNPHLGKGLIRGPLMWLISRYVAAGGRGVAYIAKLFYRLH